MGLMSKIKILTTYDLFTIISVNINAITYINKCRVMMKTFIFGGLGVIAETSEIHREAYNLAFSELSLPWQWSQSQYQDLLRSPGGEKRLENFIAQHDPRLVISAQTAHILKSRFYLDILGRTKVEPRPGLKKFLADIETKEVRLAIASTTSKSNIYGILNACGIDSQRFSMIAAKEHVTDRKPSPEVYDFVLSELSAVTSECVAIEDSGSGVASATAAGLACYAIPGLNTQSHNYHRASKVITDYSEIVI